MSVRSFLDTHVLIYAESQDEPAKMERALALIEQHHLAREAVLSTQVLNEFVNVALRKLRLPAALIRQRLAFYGRFELVGSSPRLIDQALNLHVLHQISFYDALIVQAAMDGGCKQLFSEDLQDGALFGAVRIVNPFKGLKG